VVAGDNTILPVPELIAKEIFVTVLVPVLCKTPETNDAIVLVFEFLKDKGVDTGDSLLFVALQLKMKGISKNKSAGMETRKLCHLGRYLPWTKYALEIVDNFSFFKNARGGGGSIHETLSEIILEETKTFGHFLGLPTLKQVNG
jgi:hypothetical protein